ncbi:DUF5683 domain-containing protein [Lutibacter sp. HS1-25]|uniref:DUF5683 domain-containing protein n=1 Tax=Lutibacter sp. HS1-25 TaxID=2485000 RepID=UPI0013E97F1B|nr:DUF5683 domain-containing protein [Lutibacter sp. HS1-25]
MLKKQLYLFFIATTLAIFNCFSQDNLKIKVKDTIAKVKIAREFNPLSPAKASFYSAVLPGLGQAYNRKYWKIPIVYAALGTGVYFVVWNNQNYDKYYTAYKLRLNGKPDDYDGLNGNPFLSSSTLENAQESYKSDRDLSILITIGMYVLQIIEASVNAHLLMHNIDDNLSFRPELIKNEVTNKTVAGASFKFKF